MEREDGKIIQLLSKDGALFDFKEGLRDLSKMIGSVVEDGGFDEMIPIPVATKETLNLLKNWCEIHNYEISPVAKPVKSSSLEKNLSHIDFAFFQALSQEETLQLLEVNFNSSTCFQTVRSWPILSTTKICWTYVACAYIQITSWDQVAPFPNPPQTHHCLIHSLLIEPKFKEMCEENGANPVITKLDEEGYRNLYPWAFVGDSELFLEYLKDHSLLNQAFSCTHHRVYHSQDFVHIFSLH
eukprot:TRINITY_DN1754_c0_g1_i6.p1 TRINITY_DN1754_c0_g1~~TRINITY_DN1754_c0_g1_i6.p1  ORF type:complete len:241 (-),score=-0.41 TRINITY_DN1754_c0_g1_i6:149-871(-)